MNAQRAPSGFTLIEVMVALAIVAIALAAGSRAASSVVDTSQRLNDVVLAQWCADNQLTELRLQRPVARRSARRRSTARSWAATSRARSRCSPRPTRASAASTPIVANERRPRAADDLHGDVALMSRPRPTAARAGFTLVEVMVALLIMAILAAMAFRGIDALARAKDAALASTDRTLKLNTGMSQFEYDISQIVNSKVLPQPMMFDGATLRVARRTPDGIQLVLWTLQDRRWQRWASAPFTHMSDLTDAWMRSQQWDAISGNAVTVLENVDDFQVYVCNPATHRDVGLQLEQRAVHAGRAAGGRRRRRAAAGAMASASC